MDSFSWRDATRAVFGSCLQCFPSRKGDDDDEQPQTSRGRDELESLLRNSGFSDGEMDVDALSLHSNIGQPGHRRARKKSKSKKKGSIRLFGYDLFGRPLQLDGNSDNESQSDAQRRIFRLSSSSLDSDAAPLADDVIPRLSVDKQARNEAEAARKARKERKKQKKLAALFVPSNEEFEGVPGSGPGPDDFGAFQTAPSSSTVSGPENGFVDVPRGGADEEDAAADFDAISYVRSGSRRSDSGSGTRSRTSASTSNANAQEVIVPPHLIPLPPSSAGSSSGRRKKSKRSGKRSTTTASTATDTNSQPRSPTMPVPAPHVGIVNPAWTDHPRKEVEFEGVPPDDDFTPQSPPAPYKLMGQTVHGETVFPSPGFSSSQGFPSQGFSRGSAFPSAGLGGRKNSLTANGAFLARTGDDA